MNLWSAKTVLEKSGCFNPDMKPVWVWTVIVLNAWGSCRDELLFKLSRHRAPAIWLLAVGPSAFTICWLETHTRTHAAVTVLSSTEMWQIILKKSCDLTDWVMDVLASKMVSCLSAEVKHDMNHQRGEDSFTFGWSQTGDTVKKKKKCSISLEFACFSSHLHFLWLLPLTKTAEYFDLTPWVRVHVCDGYMPVTTRMGFKANWLSPDVFCALALIFP